MPRGRMRKRRTLLERQGRSSGQKTFVIHCTSVCNLGDKKMKCRSSTHRKLNPVPGWGHRVWSTIAGVPLCDGIVLADRAQAVSAHSVVNGTRSGNTYLAPDSVLMRRLRRKVAVWSWMPRQLAWHGPFVAIGGAPHGLRARFPSRSRLALAEMVRRRDRQRTGSRRLAVAAPLQLRIVLRTLGYRCASRIGVGSRQAPAACGKRMASKDRIAIGQYAWEPQPVQQGLPAGSTPARCIRRST